MAISAPTSSVAYFICLCTTQAYIVVIVVCNHHHCFFCFYFKPKVCLLLFPEGPCALLLFFSVCALHPRSSLVCFPFIPCLLHLPRDFTSCWLRWSSWSCASSWWSAKERNHPSAKDRRLVTPMIMMNIQVSASRPPPTSLRFRSVSQSWTSSHPGKTRSRTRHKKVPPEQ